MVVGIYRFATILNLFNAQEPLTSVLIPWLNQTLPTVKDALS